MADLLIGFSLGLIVGLGFMWATLRDSIHDSGRRTGWQEAVDTLWREQRRDREQGQHSDAANLDRAADILAQRVESLKELS